MRFLVANIVGICQGCAGYPLVLERVWPTIERWRCVECAVRERATETAPDEASA